MEALACPVGYYETVLRCATGQTNMHVWLPLRAATTQLGTYKIAVHTGKKAKVLASMMLRHGMPSWLLCCLPVVKHALPTWRAVYSGVGEPDMLADASSIRGLVIIAHGLADGPLVLAHVAERLAALGYIVAAPSFSDDSCSDAETDLCQFGRGYITDRAFASDGTRSLPQ